MRLLILICIQLITINLSAQITFEKGYFLDNEGNKTICSIKNIDWKNNPTSITYRLHENSTSIKTIDEIQEFGIYGKSK